MLTFKGKVKNVSCSIFAKEKVKKVKTGIKQNVKKERVSGSLSYYVLLTSLHHRGTRFLAESHRFEEMKHNLHFVVQVLNVLPLIQEASSAALTIFVLVSSAGI